MCWIFKKIINKIRNMGSKAFDTKEKNVNEDSCDQITNSNAKVDLCDSVIYNRCPNSMFTKESVLKDVYGFDSFRYNQEKIIDEIMNGNDILSIMPTGSGKSLCYQIPAMLLEGTTIVISPLISLMDDQILKLKSNGVDCTLINSTLSDEENLKIKNEIVNGKYKIIYIAPERLQNKDFAYIVSKLNIKLVVVDEAHCVSQWGNDFRKAYLSINNFVNKINPRPVVAAFTATATKTVQEDIISMLGLDKCKVIKGSFDRPNLYISKQYIVNKNKNEFILKYLNANKDRFGIIYCSTRANVEELYDLLANNDISVGKYHAGMDDKERKQNQEDFIYDRINIIVATNAFGMGIDKPNVNFVIHYNCPKDIESYYQEIGRAGRDGIYAECILLYNGQDFNISKFLIDKTYEEEKYKNTNIDIAQSVYEYKLDKLEKMKMLCYSKECIKKYILNYFGEKRLENCNNCSICENEFEEVDVTDECNKILELVRDYNERYGETTLSDILKGSKSKKIIGLGLNLCDFYGALNTLTISQIRDLFSNLLYDGYIYKTIGDYPMIGINENGINQLNNVENKIFIKKIKEEKSKEIKEKIIINRDLVYKLKEVRLELARKENVPAYIIFSDKTLENMCELLPTSIDSFLKVSGVGPFKANKYGKDFIQVINDYIEKYDRQSIEYKI